MRPRAGDLEILSEETLLEIPRNNGGIAFERVVVKGAHETTVCYQLRVIFKDRGTGALVRSPVFVRIRRSEMLPLAEMFGQHAAPEDR